MNEGWNTPNKPPTDQRMVLVQTHGGLCEGFYRDKTWVLKSLGFNGVEAWQEMPERYIKPLTDAEKLEKIKELIGEYMTSSTLGGWDTIDGIREVLK